MTTEQLSRLDDPFEESEVEWRIGRICKRSDGSLVTNAMAYITNRAVMSRLDEVFGKLGWRNIFKEWKTTSQICGISVWDEQTRRWITKFDGADDTDIESVKGGLSDSMKRAACQWGIGRYLYSFDTSWAPIKEVGKNKKGDPIYNFITKPKQPAFALHKPVGK